MSNEVKNQSKELRREETRDSDKNTEKEQVKIQELKSNFVESLMNTKQKLIYITNMKNKMNTGDSIVEEPISSTQIDPWLLNNG